MTENSEEYLRSVPRDESGRLELLALHPPLWEYLLFGNVLYVRRAAHEDRWRDFQLGYTLKVGPVVEPIEIPKVIGERFSYALALTRNVEYILDRPAQERAFGKPGESGDAILIEHMAARLIDLYVLLLDWAEETRALRVPDWAERLKELVTNHVRQPLEQIHDFVDEFIVKIELAIESLAEGNTSDVSIIMPLTFELDDALVREYEEELQRVGQRLR